MHHALTVAAEVLGAAAVITFIGSRLIERVHPPRGRFIEIDGLRQHVVELGAAVPAAKLVVLPGIGHMLHHVAADRVIAEIEQIAKQI
jgi:pimeloyl-ACP methyl ester carboxylesterase